MTWVWILLALLGVAVTGALVAVLATVVRTSRRLEAEPRAAVADPDPVVVQERVDEALAARRRELDDERSRLESLAAEHRNRVRAVDEREAAAERLRTESTERLEHAERRMSEAAARLAEAEEGRDAAERWATQERADLRSLRSTLEAREHRLGEREERVMGEGRVLDDRSSHLAEERRRLDTEVRELAAGRDALRVEAAEGRDQVLRELQRVAGLDQAQARAEVLARVEHEARLEATSLARDIEQTATREAERRARATIVTAIQRLASDQTSESVVSTVDLPSDEMKGRIIGREGRNIRHFEQVTGVNVMIDDTPGSVLLSCFDPVRREVARLTLSELVADGRIHPARIEEVHERSRERIHERCIRAAEDALAEVGISDLDPDLLPVLGALRYRTSYGQNVLRHLVECGHLAGMMASELGLDRALCTRAAFLHDIGKALTHEHEGSHAMVGAELARRHGESPEVVHAIEAHHNEVEPTTVEAVLTQAADAISGARPGARRESLEAYVHRLERLEQIAASHEGVDRVFAMQAGREVRVMVSPDVLDDSSSHALARDIAHEIQDELTYPGQIRVTVVRESRATEVAH